MCGIFGYVGTKNAVEILIGGLKRLEYRGYDSSGYAVVGENGIVVVKDAARVSTLPDCGVVSGIGIGHTRWATHGKATAKNAHPHISYDGRIAVVHNGIIENCAALRKELLAQGIKMVSETDSELIAHLIASAYKGDLPAAIRVATERLTGAYSILVMAVDQIGQLCGYRKNASLIVGLGDGENYFASDMHVLSPYTKTAVILEDDDLVLLTREKCEITRFARPKNIKAVRITSETIDDKVVSTYMQKEIEEIPEAVFKTVSGMLSPEGVASIPEAVLKNVKSVYIGGCGTAYHAGLYGKFMLEHLARLETEVVIASETRASALLFKRNKLAIFISQSGETSDTLAAIKIAKGMGSPTVAITNTRGSSITRIADYSLYLDAGPEIAVAATKSYNCQLAALYIFAVTLARLQGKIGVEYEKKLLNDLMLLQPDLKSAICDDTVCTLAERLIEYKKFFFIGRGVDYVTAREGALKFKELTYNMADAYPSGELKHGTIALIDDEAVIVSVITQSALQSKAENARRELCTRGGKIISVSTLDGVAEISLRSRCGELLAPLVAIIPLQKLALTVASKLKLDVDKPRNLAKSVTVE
jgi:glucosamine--fructose-6-phosphate aminotransferase (isomerizing)